MNPHAAGINGAVADILKGLIATERTTQAKVSETTGIPLVSIQRYIAAKRVIDVEVLDKIARALGTDAVSVLAQAAARLSGGESDRLD